MVESSPNLPEEPRQSAPVVNLTGAGYIRFVSIVLVVGAAFLAFDVCFYRSGRHQIPGK
jgi:hypothetical protein